MTEKSEHANDERTVICPVEGCDSEVLARGLHLHVRQSTTGNHGEQGEVPDDVDLDDAKDAGTKEVKMEYPNERETEGTARLCPYCHRPFSGKTGVMIHLGQTEGRKNHPSDATDRHDEEDFAIAHVDDDGNIVEVVKDGPLLSSITSDTDSLTDDDVQELLQSLRAQDLNREANMAEKLLL